jgi:hypothetical protein
MEAESGTGYLSEIQEGKKILASSDWELGGSNPREEGGAAAIIGVWWAKWERAIMGVRFGGCGFGTLAGRACCPCPAVEHEDQGSGGFHTSP